MPTANNITSAYLNFWLKFRTATKGYDYTPKLPQLITQSIDDSIEFSLQKPLHLIKWPYKYASTRKTKMDILISSSEFIIPENLTITKSTVQVSYFINENDTVEPIESIHYDFEIGQIDHPFFHAQMCSNLVDSSTCESFNKYSLKDIKKFKRFKCLRIPSAHMNLISVLTSIVADHLGERILQELIYNIKKVQYLPKVDAQKLFNNINKDKKNFRSLHWYQCQKR
jgi:hypothetical protein